LFFHKSTVKDALIDGDKVAVQVTSYHTLAGSGKQTRFMGMIIAVVKNGKRSKGGDSKNNYNTAVFPSKLQLPTTATLPGYHKRFYTPRRFLIDVYKVLKRLPGFAMTVPSKRVDRSFAEKIMLVVTQVNGLLGPFLLPLLPRLKRSSYYHYF
jgi:hypothetical protein